MRIVVPLCLVAVVLAGSRTASESRTADRQNADVQAALDEGSRLQRAGDAAGARESFLWALQSSAPQSRERGHALLALAGLEVSLGQYVESARHAEDAERLFESLGDDKGAAAALNRRGVTALYAGDYATAERLLRSALDSSTRRGDREGRAEHLANLANVMFFVGRYADAADLYDEALKVTSAAAGAAWTARRKGLILANQATLYQRLGRDQEALAAYSTVTAAPDALSPREQAEMFVNIGVLYRRLGDPIKALEMYDKGRALFSRERAVDGELYALNNRGIVLALDLGRLDEAETSFSMALDRASRGGSRRVALLARLYRGEARLRGGNQPGAREDFEAGLALARELKTPEDEWKALYGLGRVERDPARAVQYLDEAVRTIESIREALRIEALRSDFLSDKRVVYDALIRTRLSSRQPDAIFNLLERSHSRVWRDRLHLASSVELAAIQQALPERMLLLDYWNSAQGSAIVAVGKHRTAVIPIDIDEHAVSALIGALSSGPSTTWRALATEVAAKLLPPADWFDGIEHVAVVPDGAVASVPFDVLPVAGRLLLERAAVSYTPTAATLLREASHAPRWLAPWTPQVRVFADPIRAGGIDASLQLRASETEAREVASELAGRAVLHLREESRKSYLISTAERAPLLHLATHAIADAGALEQSRILFSPAPGSAHADFLYLKEAYRLPLADVELAVLSACDTERGRSITGEGVQTFSRAFMASGVRTTVTTMWRVADQPTADLMALFYHHLQRGEPRDEALRRAKLRLLASGSQLSDPHFWAAFVLTGDADRPIPRAISWTTITLAAVASAAGLALAIQVLQRCRRPAVATV